MSSNIMKSPSPKCYMTFLDMTIYSDILNWSYITPICELITELDLITDFDLVTKFWEVSIEHCNGCGRGRILLRTPGAVPFVLMLRPFFPELVMSTDLLSFEHPSVLLFCLLWHPHNSSVGRFGQPWYSSSQTQDQHNVNETLAYPVHWLLLLLIHQFVVLPPQ